MRSVFLLWILCYDYWSVTAFPFLLHYIIYHVPGLEAGTHVTFFLCKLKIIKMQILSKYFKINYYKNIKTTKIYDRQMETNKVTSII